MLLLACVVPLADLDGFLFTVVDRKSTPGALADHAVISAPPPNRLVELVNRSRIVAAPASGRALIEALLVARGRGPAVHSPA